MSIKQEVKEEPIDQPELNKKSDHKMSNQLEKWSCYICKSSDYIPTMIITCGHTFCEECIIKIKECSICRKPFADYEVQTNYALVTNHKRKREAKQSFEEKITESIRESKRKYISAKRLRLNKELEISMSTINSVIEKANTNAFKLKVNIDIENITRLVEIYKKANITIDFTQNRRTSKIEEVIVKIK